VTPTPAQASAIAAIVDWHKAIEHGGPREFYLAGYAGTGKSTTANEALEVLRDKCGVRCIETGAFTGKAAHVLRKKGVAGARTIHSMIYSPQEDAETGEMRFVLAIDGPASLADLIVLDECSMVGEQMADDLRSFGKPILVMGDPGQLPPVAGAGAFTNRKPDVFLTEIHRQAEGSPILRIATWARQGKPVPTGDYGDGVEVRDLTRETQPLVYRQDSQPICGVHRVRWVYTQRIRQRLGYAGPLPQKGERIICCKNDHNRGLFNGALGEAMDDAKRMEDSAHVKLSARMDDLPVPIKDIEVHPYLFAQHFTGPCQRPRFRGAIEFDWGYILTCHKSQGSEWPHVTVIDDSASFREDRAKWLYTAVTRASSGLALLKRAA
jgi:exodeoxyribonuclease-5